MAENFPIRLRALVFADIHAPDVFRLSKLNPEQVDVVFTLGDIAVGTLDYIVMQAGTIPVVGVPGNHDGKDLPGVINVHRKTFSLNGVTIGGFGGARRYKDHPNHFYEWQVYMGLLCMPPVDIFLSHAPPAMTSQEEGKVHQGFSSFDRYIRKKSPRYWLHGHIYRAYNTTIHNTNIVCVQERCFMDLTLQKR